MSVPDLSGVFRTETDASVSWLGLPLLRKLARGAPVNIYDLAAETDTPVERVRQVLARQSDIEYDEQGRIVGNGITLRPTPHQFEVDGQRLYTWCALDTLVFPAMLGKPARVQSPCYASGVPIQVEVEPDRIESVEPATAVVSLVTPGDCSAIRASFCEHVHLFAGAELASGWLQHHAGGSLVPVAEAQRLVTSQCAATEGCVSDACAGGT